METKTQNARHSTAESQHTFLQTDIIVPTEDANDQSRIRTALRQLALAEERNILLHHS
jgi:hypothetical protein